MPLPVPTVDELVETIKLSSLPTVLIEGSDDMIIYRWMEGQLGAIGGDFLVCGGRTALLKLHERRAEFAASKVVFVADRDMWLYSSVPPEYTDVIFTDGYSIENDIYVHSDIERLLDPDEVPAHKSLLEVICRWFAFEVEEYLANKPPLIDTHINAVVPVDANSIDPAFIRTAWFRRTAS